ncbi:MAG: ricin-type beta-trefoil lectin domain protein [Candidatus Microthrix sp.]|uniref:Ricin-type beta-trefoil lectin domain protein n=1 Tax=Candidatus Neomicrothrix subdominans TaxID=2954438 RepID=A0A936TD61_9ACTN|nr:ricin-type beta-trefoil lectin domain protein [Candidatus Microthrix sp.]MBK9296998.1 ricin-type beta-trefoil lectin domain protein [Candidatus Microthrix subdominans]
MAGEAGAKRQALVHFDLRPGDAKCDDGTPIPKNRAVRSVELRLYTWQVTGTPNCDTACNHALRRVTGDWNQGTATWGSAPMVDANPTAKFKHGSGAGDSPPRHQVITGANLDNDTSLFYQAAAFNRGWSIEQDCGPSGLDCQADAPGFRMRTREWPNESQRPVLSIVFMPNNDAGLQLRNLGNNACASIDNGNFADGVSLISLGCAGRPDQLWEYTAGTDAGQGQFEAVSSAFCLRANGSAVSIQPCNGGSTQQRWDIVGLEIKSRSNPNLCLAAGKKLGSPLVVQTCNGLPEQQWAFGPPATSVPSPAIRLTALDTGGQATGDCADIEVRRGDDPFPRHSPEVRWTQTFPCLGAARTNQQWNMSPDGRFVNKKFPGNCLGYDGKIAAVEVCKQGGGQLWVVEGTQIRNIQASRAAGVDRCLTGFGGRQWLELANCDPNRTGQAWSLDPFDAPAMATAVQLRNNKHGDCLETNGAVTEGQWIWTQPCGGLDRPAQSFVQLKTNEWVSLANPAMCITTRGGAGLQASECARLIGDANTVPNNPTQQWTTTNLSQFKRATVATCAQGNGNFQYATQVGCATSGDISAQQWSPEELGTATSQLRQMRNLDSNSCADLRTGANAIAWPCGGPDRAIQGVLLAKVGDDFELRLADNPNLCLDVQNGGTENAAVAPIGCNYGAYQRWTLSADGQLKTKAPGNRCLQGGLDNAPLAMRDCSTAAAQRWEFEAPTDTRQLKRIRNIDTGNCLDVVGTVTQNQAYTGFPCSGGDRPNQSFVQLNNGAFASAASNANLCIDAGYSNGAAVLPWACKNPVASHQWRVQGTQFQQVGSGRCAEFNPGSNTAQVQPCNRPNQAWAVEDVDGASSSALQFRSASTAGDRFDGCLDIDGTTRSGYANNDRLIIMPCLGAARTNQSFRLMSNGLIRSTGSPDKCLDAALGSLGRPVLWDCAANKDDQRWKIENGQIKNVTQAGVPRGRCIQGGIDGVQAIMGNCSTTDEQWISEVHGSKARADAVGRLRTPSSNLCLEPNAAQGNDPLSTWGWPCAASGRTQQRFVRLNSGQYRPVGNLGFCLDANGGTDGAVPRTLGCISPTDNAGTPQRWVIDTNAWLSSVASQLCVEAPGSGLVLRQRACAINPTNPRQLWTFVPEAGL